MPSTKLNTEDRIYLASRLKDARLASGFTQDQLAEKLGKTQSFVAKYETRERSLEFFEVLAICAVLNIQVQQLVNETKRHLISSESAKGGKR